MLDESIIKQIIDEDIYKDSHNDKLYCVAYNEESSKAIEKATLDADILTTIVSTVVKYFKDVAKSNRKFSQTELCDKVEKLATKNIKKRNNKTWYEIDKGLDLLLGDKLNCTNCCLQIDDVRKKVEPGDLAMHGNQLRSIVRNNRYYYLPNIKSIYMGHYHILTAFFRHGIWTIFSGTLENRMSNRYVLTQYGIVIKKNNQFVIERSFFHNPIIKEIGKFSNEIFFVSLNKKGEILFKSKKYTDALNCTEEMIKYFPNSANGWINRGVSLNELGRYKEALESIEKGMKLGPIDAKDWSNKVLSLIGLGRYEDALNSSEEALKLDNKNVKIWINKGVILVNIGKYKDALLSIEEALKLDHNNVIALINKSSIIADRLKTILKL
jgi:tetratricopeptide (TPR) repeat protein